MTVAELSESFPTISQTHFNCEPKKTNGNAKSRHLYELFPGGKERHHCGNTRHLWESKTPFWAQKTPIWEHEMPRRGNKRTPVGTRNTCGNKKQQSGKKRRTGREPGTENPEPKGHRRSRNPIPTRTAGTQHYTASHTS